MGFFGDSASVDGGGGRAERPLPSMDGLRRRARRSSVEYLSKRSASEAGLREVMRRRCLRWHPQVTDELAEEIAAYAVSFCREHGFLDDLEYARARVRSGVRSGRSRRQIAADLRARGVEAEDAAEAVGDADDMVAALGYARRRGLGPWRRGEATRERVEKERAALGRRGFGYDVISRVLSMDAGEAEDFLLGR